MSETKKYAEMMIAMSTDYLMGGITEETYKSNLGIVASILAPKEPKQ
jgi:hypothetical protein